jgi:hypothetical protein
MRHDASSVALPEIRFRGRAFPRRVGFVALEELTCCLGHERGTHVGRDGRLRCYHRLERNDARSPRCGALQFVLVFPSPGTHEPTLTWAADVDEGDLRTIERDAMSVRQILHYFGASFSRR